MSAPEKSARADMSCSVIPHGRVIASGRDLKPPHGCCSPAPNSPHRCHSSPSRYHPKGEEKQSLRCPSTGCDAATHGCSSWLRYPQEQPLALPLCSPLLEVLAEARLCPEHLHPRGPVAKGDVRERSPRGHAGSSFLQPTHQEHLNLTRGKLGSGRERKSPKSFALKGDETTFPSSKIPDELFRSVEQQLC